LTNIRFVFGTCLILSTATCVLGQPEGLSCAEVLQRYRESLSYLQSVSMRILQVVDSNDNELFPQTFDFVFRRDSQTNRAEWVGKRVILNTDGSIDLHNSDFIKDIADGNMFVNLEGMRFAEGPDARRVLLWYNYTDRLNTLVENPNWSGPLFGKMYGSSYRSVPDLLAEAADLHLLDKKENTNGTDCFVLEGTTRYGKVTAWIAPEKGYTAMKWIIEKRAEDLFDDTVISRKWPSVQGSKVVFDLKELQEIRGEDGTAFVPKLAYFTHAVSFRDGSRKTYHYKYETSEVKLDPDFEALGAFKVDLPDGIRVFIRDMPDLKFRWQNGKPVAYVDQAFIVRLDKEIEHLKGEVKTKSVDTTIEKSEVAPNQPTGLQDTKRTAPQDVREPERKPAAESGPSHAWALILIGLIIVAAVIALVFRRLKPSER